MDRTAWIAVALCILGLVLWEVYSFKQVQPKPVTSTAYPTAGSPTPSASASSPPSVAPGSTNPSATPSPPAQPSPSVAPFAEVTETLRNSDLELHLTNRGGGIAKAVLLNHLAE